MTRLSRSVFTKAGFRDKGAREAKKTLNRARSLHLRLYKKTTFNELETHLHDGHNYGYDVLRGLDRKRLELHHRLIHKAHG